MLVGPKCDHSLPEMDDFPLTCRFNMHENHRPLTLSPLTDSSKTLSASFGEKKTAVLVSLLLTAGYRQMKGFPTSSHDSLPTVVGRCFSLPLNVAQMALEALGFDYKFSKGYTFHIIVM